MRLERLSKPQRLELCRISQQGLQQAAETLSRLLRQPVAVEVADAWMADGQQSASSSEHLLGICLQLSGDVNGCLLLTLTESCAQWLSNQLLGCAESRELLQEPASSTLKEVGNIIASSFLACLDDQLDLRAMPSPPQLSCAPLEQLLEGCRLQAENACLIVRTRLSGADASEGCLQGAIYLFSDPGSLTKLLEQIDQG